MLARTDNTAAVSYINRLGGIRSHRMSQLARHLLLWSHMQFKSLRAVHIPGQLNRAADALSRQLTFPGEWRLHPETIRLMWSRFGEAQVDLFASPESSHCQLYFSLTEGPFGTDALAHSWPRALRKYAFPPVSLLAQTLCKLREDEEQVLLVAPHWPTRTWFPELISLATAPPWRIPLRQDLLSQGLGTIWHPRSDLWNRVQIYGTSMCGSWTGRGRLEWSTTIIRARAPSTRQTYALKWSLFVNWCSSRREDPRRCMTGVMLSFLKERLERRLSPSTLKVYVAAIAAHHDAVDGRSLGKHDLIVRFLKGALQVPGSIELWSHMQFKSLRAVHIPGQLNRAADALSRQLTFPGEWRLHPETIRLMWSRFGEAQVDLFASPESSHCQLYFSLTEGPFGTDALAHSWPRALRKYAFPPVSLLAQTLCKLREDEEQVLLVAPHWPTRTWFPELISLATAPPWRIPLRQDLLSQGLGTIWHPRSDLWNCVQIYGTSMCGSWTGRGRLEWSTTIIRARAPSTRQTYALKWSLFVNWCSSRREDPRRCMTGVMLSFLKERLERRLSPSTLKVYVAAIVAHHDAVDGRSLGKHDLIVRFLKGALQVPGS